MTEIDLQRYRGKVRRWNPHTAIVSGRSLLPIIIRETQDHDKREVDTRLMAGAPQVAIHANAESHPAAVYDLRLARALADAVWEAGGVAYISTQPTVCDGIAQEHLGMRYSLVSRNRMARVYNEVMHALGCNAAIVLQTCDKQPTGAVAGAVLYDRWQRKRGHEAVPALFLPAPLMEPGPIDAAAQAEIERLAAGLEARGEAMLRERLLANHRQTNTSVKNIVDRTIFADIRHACPDLLSAAQLEALEHELYPDASATGGMCAFNGTANSSRNVTAGLGLVPEGFDLLDAPYTETLARRAVAALYDNLLAGLGVADVVADNLPLAAKVWSATGGSTNLALHLPFVMNALGWEGNLTRLLELRGEGVPDLFDLKVEEGRSFWELARQRADGHHSGLPSLVRVLHDLGVIDDAALDARTVTGTWRERLARARPVAAEPPGRQIYRTGREVPTSGIQIVTGNLGRSAVIKISGVRREKIERFDDKVFLALPYLSEEEATQAIGDREAFFRTLVTHPDIRRDLLLAAARHNLRLPADSPELARLAGLEPEALLEALRRQGALMVMVTIGGVGIKAMGMPEMCKISHDIMYNPLLADTCLLLTDGRISGTNKGFVIVHNEPEAYERGPMLGVRTGDPAHLRLDDRRNTQSLNLLDAEALVQRGEVAPLDAAAMRARVEAVADERIAVIEGHRALLEPMLLDDLAAMTNAYEGGSSRSMVRRPAPAADAAD